MILEVKMLFSGLIENKRHPKNSIAIRLET